MRKWISSAELLDVSSDATVGIRKVFTASIETPTDGTRVSRFRITTDDADRDRDVITADGWELDDFIRGKGPILWAHDYSAPPVGRTLSISTDEHGMSAEIEYAPAEVYAFADTIYRLVKGGYINATSVGFQPLEWNYDEQRRGVNFKRQSLLEVSLCPVPANPYALIEARAAGIEVEPLKAWAESVLAKIGAPERTVRLGFGDVILPEVRIEGTAEGVRGLWTGWAPITTTIISDAFDSTALGTPTLDVDAIKAAIAKRGRVLSSANEGRLREAAEAAQAADTKIREVVAQVEAAPEAEPSEGDPSAKDACPMGADCPKGDAAECPKGEECPMAGGKEATVEVAPSSPETRAVPSGDEVLDIDLVDDPDELDMSEADVRAVIEGVTKEMGRQIQEGLSRELAMARGRVD